MFLGPTAPMVGLDSGVPYPVLHSGWQMRGRQWSLACGHTLGSMHYNCRACQEEYVAAEQAQMIVRPEGEPPLNPEGDPTKPFGGSYRWDFISRYIDGFRLQLAAEGKDGYDAQMKQYLSAEAARYQGFVARYGTAGPPHRSSCERSIWPPLQIRDLQESRVLSIWPPWRPAAESQGAEHLLCAISASWLWSPGSRAFGRPCVRLRSPGSRAFGRPCVRPQSPGS